MNVNTINVNYASLDNAKTVLSNGKSTLSSNLNNIKSVLDNINSTDVFEGPIANDALNMSNEIYNALNDVVGNIDNLTGVLENFKTSYSDTDTACDNIVSLAAQHGYNIISANRKITLSEAFLYNQGNYRNLDNPDNGNSISASGCSYCSAAAVLSVVMGSNNYDPKWVVNKVKELGIADSGNRYTYLPKLATNLGLSNYSADGKNDSEMERVWNDLAAGNSAAQLRIKPHGRIGGKNVSESGHYVQACAARVVDGKKQVLIYDSNGGKQYWDNWDTVKSALADYGVDNDSVTVVKTGGIKA